MATFAYTIGGVCEKIHIAAKDYAKKNYAFNLGRQLGALDFLLSPTNGGIKTEISQNEDNKIVRAKVLYKQRSLPCQILTGTAAQSASICDTAHESAIKEADVTIDDRIAMQPRKFTNSLMKQICEGNQSVIDDFLSSDLRAMREKLDEKLLALMAAGVGVKKRQDGSTVATGTYTDENLLSTSTGQPIPLTGNYNKILMDYSNMQFSGTPALIGQGNLQQYFTLAGLACCNSATPYSDALSKAGAAFYLDQAANSILGANRFVMAAFGASHLMWFNENSGIKINDDHMKNMVVPDPVYPQLKWDLDFHYDDCTKTWTYMYSAYFDIFNVFQADSFAQNDPTPACDDELYGVTGLWGYRAQSAS